MDGRPRTAGFLSDPWRRAGAATVEVTVEEGRENPRGADRRTHEERRTFPRRSRWEQKVRADLCADRVVVPPETTGGVVLTLEGGFVRILAAIEHRNGHAHNKKERREAGREGSSQWPEGGHGGLTLWQGGSSCQRWRPPPAHTRPAPRLDKSDHAPEYTPNPQRRVPTMASSGRGTNLNPTSRFEPLDHEPTPGADHGERTPVTKFFRDSARSVLVQIDSPDVGYDVGINPYRGCEHGCVYCFARPNHEYLGLSAGLDFETKIMVKHEAPSLLRAALRKPSWRVRPILFSGTTDPYQPVERRLGITRGCLEVLSEARQPVALITKNAGITRDLDLLRELARHDAVRVTLSVTTLRRDLQRQMEPRTSTPRKRLRTIRDLANAGIPVGVNLAPVIPGLTDEEIPAILAAARDAGAAWAGYILLRLPHGVKDLFENWLREHFPDRRDRVLNKLREMHGGALYDSRFGVRGKGSGPYADQLKALFRTTARKLGYDAPPPLNTAAFRAPAPAGQLSLF